MKSYIYHKANGTLVEVETDPITKKELSRKIIVRLVYATNNLSNKIVDFVKTTVQDDKEQARPTYADVKRKFMSGAQTYSQEDARALLSEIDNLRQAVYNLKEEKS